MSEELSASVVEAASSDQPQEGEALDNALHLTHSDPPPTSLDSDDNTDIPAQVSEVKAKSNDSTSNIEQKGEQAEANLEQAAVPSPVAEVEQTVEESVPAESIRVDEEHAEVVQVAPEAVGEVEAGGETSASGENVIGSELEIVPGGGERRLRRLLLRRVLRQRRKSPLHPLVLGLVIIILLGLLVPLVVTVSYGIRLYTTYTQVRAHADQGIHHLMDIKELLKPDGETAATTAKPQHSLLDSTKLTRAQAKLRAAQDDFKEVRQLLEHNDVLQAVTNVAPQYQPQLQSASAAAQVGIDVTTIGQQVLTVGQQLAPRFGNSLLDSKDEPLLFPEDLTLIEDTLVAVQPALADIQKQTGLISLDALPLSASQHAQLQHYLTLVPQIPTYIQQGREWLASAGWLLGLEKQRTFLVQPMDRGELRATGGFTGQYGELTLKAGRLSPITLTNIALVEYSPESPTYGEEAPEVYRSWWPFANWGLRDSNLSVDFPTSAKLALDRYHNDFKRNVDGVISFTPTFIQHILQAMGPLYVPQYNETVTAQNLEEKLHYYQLDGRGIEKEKKIAGVTDDDHARKHFTATLAHTLMERVRQSSLTDLFALARQAVQDLKTRDLQVYFTDPQAESLLAKYELAGALDRSTEHDGLYIVQVNVSVSKASEYVHTSFADNVTLDSSGGATHRLQMRFVYNQIGPVYGFDTYRDYVRVYVPQNAQLLGGSGFDQGYDHPHCGGYLNTACPATNAFPKGELICPSGGYVAGDASWMLGDPYYGVDHPLNELGPPPDLHSDEQGRAMFGGYLVIPKNCTLTATISWYVPAQSQQDYSLLVQRQAGTTPDLQVTIQQAGVQDVTKEPVPLFKGKIASDQLFTLEQASGNA